MRRLSWSLQYYLACLFLFILCHDLHHTLMWPLHATTHLSVYVYVCVCMFGSSGKIPLTMHGRYVQARVQRWMVEIINWKPLPRCGWWRMRKLPKLVTRSACWGKKSVSKFPAARMLSTARHHHVCVCEGWWCVPYSRGTWRGEFFFFWRWDNLICCFWLCHCRLFVLFEDAA